MSDRTNELILYCEHVGCPNGHTTRSGLCEACARITFDRLVARVAEVELERNAYKFAGEQAMGMGTGQVILDERDRLKMQVRELEEQVDAYERTVKQSDNAHARTREERDALRAWNFPVLAWLGRWRDRLPPEAVVYLQDICDTPKATP